MERAQFGVPLDHHRLRELRKRRGMSVSALAAASRISPQYMSFIERGKRRPLQAVLDRICDALNLTDEERDDLVSLQPAAGNAA